MTNLESLLATLMLLLPNLLSVELGYLWIGTVSTAFIDVMKPMPNVPNGPLWRAESCTSQQR